MKTLFKINLLMITLVMGMQSCTFVRFQNPGSAEKRIVAASKERGSSSFQVADFDRVFSNLPADITYVMSEDSPSVYIEGPVNVLDLLNFDVIDGELMLTVDDGLRFRSLSDLKVRLNSSGLESMVMEGAGELDVPGGLDVASFSLTIRGVGDVEIDGLRCGDVQVAVQGAGDVEISGLDCNTVSSAIKGAGDIVLKGRADRAVVDIAGAGEIDMTDLDVNEVEKKGNGKIKR